LNLGKRKGIFLAVFFAAIALAAVVWRSSGEGAPARAQTRQAQPPAVPVKVATVVQRPEPVTVEAIGNVQPYSTVQVKSQVAGQLMRVYFKEGQDVQKGDLLFEIDPRPYEAALAQAQANKAKDLAQANNAATDVSRYDLLYQRGVIAREQYDQLQTTAAAAKATVNADEAAIENARLQLGFTKIRAPLTGRAGNLMVNEGNLVKVNDVPLVTINQIRPIYVAFSVPSQELAAIKRHMARGLLPVAASPKEGGRETQGRLSFVDNNIDTTTGTILLKGTFPNADGALWPGEFVNVKLTLSVQPDAVVAPSAAVQNGQDGQYVFVVRPDGTVESRPVVVSRTTGSDSVIASGLKAGETVVTDGQLRLVPGAKVSVEGARP
jgi:multidrug efflux system membrane fusion protein